MRILETAGKTIARPSRETGRHVVEGDRNRRVPRGNERPAVVTERTVPAVLKYYYQPYEYVCVFHLCYTTCYTVRHC